MRSVPHATTSSVNLRQRELLISIVDGHEVEIPPAPFRPPPGFDSQG